MTFSPTQANGPTERLIPIGRVAPGLYWITQHSPKKGVEHHAILDVGNRIAYPDVNPRQPIIVHQTPPSIVRGPFAGTGNWNLILKIEDEHSAIRRLIEACENPMYNATGNNCEHFARYIAVDKRESHQLQRAVFVAAAFGIAWAAAA